MARDAVFLDTAGLIGVFLASDSLHAMAVEILDSLAVSGTPLVTSDWVLIEFLNATANLRHRVGAAGFVRSLLADPGVTFVRSSHVGLQGALKLYESRPDKEWGIVDCSSILICKEMGIKRVFTHDRHFRQAGFEILL